ncbi:MAG: VWA domain-containing protein [Caldilineae bacterium]|nr:VWA domain-containing protein [Caldilineae bacterium]
MKLRRFSLLAMPILAFAGAVSLLSLPTLHAQQAPASPSTCVTGLSKTVEPGRVQRGDTARVTMIMTHTCPAERKPVDLVFLVDVSNSMTRGKNSPNTGTDPVNPDPGLATPEPKPEPPKPLAFLGWPASGVAVSAPDQGDPVPPDPGDPGLVPAPGRPGSEPSGCEGNDAVAPPVIPPIGILTPTPPGPQPPPGIGDPPPGTPDPGIGDPGIGDPGTGGSSGELAGDDDLIRDTQRWLRRFLDEPTVQQDMANGKLRIGMVAFNARGRRILSLSDDTRRVISRIGLLRGQDKTRIDIGLRSAEGAFREQTRGGIIRRDDDRVKVIVLISDGQFCSRDVSRAKVDREIKVVAIAAGRGANQRKLREVATEKQNVLILRDTDIKSLINLMSDPRNPDAIRQFIPVEMSSVTVRDSLTDTIELVAGSVNPAPASINGRTIEWVFPKPSSAITLEFDVKPLAPGIRSISDVSFIEWADSLGRVGTAHFPTATLELVAP